MVVMIAAIIIAGTMAFIFRYEGAKAGTRILRFVQDRTQTPRQVCEVERFVDDRKLVDGLMSFQHISRVPRGE